jgi:hypothetical protein
MKNSKMGMMVLSHRKTSQRIPTMRVRFTIRESGIGVEALHFRVPGRLQSIEDVLLSEAAMLFSMPDIGFSELSFSRQTAHVLGLFLFRVPRTDIEVA